MTPNGRSEQFSPHSASKPSSGCCPPIAAARWGGFVAFLDIAYGVSGPVAGVIASQFGYAAVYFFGAVCALFGAALAVAPRRPQT
jgi:predicted MFS family arabinose efflux permease